MFSPESVDRLTVLRARLAWLVAVRPRPRNYRTEARRLTAAIVAIEAAAERERAEQGR